MWIWLFHLGYHLSHEDQTTFLKLPNNSYPLGSSGLIKSGPWDFLPLAFEIQIYGLGGNNFCNDHLMHIIIAVWNESIIRRMKSRKSIKLVQVNQSSLARNIQCSNTASDTRKKTAQLIQKPQQSSRLDIGNQKYHQSM